MRIAGLPRVLGGCLLLAACIATNALSQPQPVPRLRDRALDKASYVALANQWREYIEKHGETADALVNLGRAQRYSGELEAATRAGKRAVELEPAFSRRRHPLRAEDHPRSPRNAKQNLEFSKLLV